MKRKKDFANNPAMLFISKAKDQDPQEIPEPARLASGSEPPEGQITVFEVLGTADKDPAEDQTQRDGSGRQSPTEAGKKCLTGHARDADPGEHHPKRPEMPAGDPPEGFLYREKKSRRVQIVLRPSTYEQARQAAKAAGVSFNKFIEAAITEKLQK